MIDKTTFPFFTSLSLCLFHPFFFSSGENSMRPTAKLVGKFCLHEKKVPGLELSYISRELSDVGPGNQPWDLWKSCKCT